MSVSVRDVLPARPAGWVTLRISLLFLATMPVNGCGTTGRPSEVAEPAPVSEQVARPDFDCDARSGGYSAANVGLPSGPWRVTGQLKFLTARDNLYWAAIASIQVIYSGQNDVVLTLFVRRGDNVVRIISGTSRYAQADLRLANALPNDPAIDSMPLTPAQIPFALAMDPAGNLSESVGDVDIPLSPRITGATRLVIQCSTAHVRFSNVVVESYDTSRSD